MFNFFKKKNEENKPSKSVIEAIDSEKEDELLEAIAVELSNEEVMEDIEGDLSEEDLSKEREIRRMSWYLHNKTKEVLENYTEEIKIIDAEEIGHSLSSEFVVIERTQNSNKEASFKVVPAKHFNELSEEEIFNINLEFQRLYQVGRSEVEIKTLQQEILIKDKQMREFSETLNSLERKFSTKIKNLSKEIDFLKRKLETYSSTLKIDDLYFSMAHLGSLEVLGEGGEFSMFETEKDDSFAIGYSKQNLGEDKYIKIVDKPEINKLLNQAMKDSGGREDSPLLLSFYEKHGLRFVSKMKGDLTNYTSYDGPTLKKNTFLNIAEQLTLGIKALFDKGLRHSDLKPQNILLDEYKDPKIIDFGGVVELESEFSVYTEGYIFPEYYKSNPSKEDFRTGDMYSLGVILHELLTKGAVLPHEKMNLDLFSEDDIEEILKLYEDPSNVINELEKDCDIEDVEFFYPLVAKLFSSDRPTPDEFLKMLNVDEEQIDDMPMILEDEEDQVLAV